MNEEYERNESILIDLRKMLSSDPPDTNGSSTQPNFAVFSTNSHTDNSQQPLTTQTNFTLSQLPALKSIITELRPKLAKAHATHLNVESAKDERREERRDYVEQRIKAHLGKNAHVSTDDAAGLSSRNVDMEEVEALEKVAAGFVPLPPR